MIKRVLNLRTFFITSVTLIFIILGCYITTFNKTAGIAVLAFCGLILLALLGLFIYRKKQNFVVAVALSMIFSFIAVLSFFIRVENTVQIRPDKIYSVTGKITKIHRDATQPRLYLSALRIGGQKLDYNLCLYLKGSEDITHFKADDVVGFEAKLKDKPFFNDGEVDFAALSSGVRYTATVKITQIKIVESKLSVKSAVKQYLLRFLQSGLGSKYGGLAYGMITGDRFAIDELTSDYFGIAGLGHILAVSGLHIGFIAAMLSFVFKKLKVKRIVSVFAITAILYAYVDFTDFSPSCLRAFILHTLYMLAGIKGKRADGFNFLSFACTVLLAANPFNLFNVSFLMSFGCIFGIIIFNKPIVSALEKIKIPSFLARPLALSAAVQLGSLPPLIYFFNTIQLYSVPVNLILLPVLSLVFTGLMLSIIFVNLCPLLSFIFYPLKWGLFAVDSAAALVAQWPYAKIMLYGSGAIFALYAFYLLMSRFIMVKGKPLISMFCVAACAVCVALPSMPIPLKNYIAPVGGVFDVESVVTVKGETFIVGDFSEIYLYEKLQSLKITKVDAIVTGYLDNTAAHAIVSFYRKFPTKVICRDYDKAEGMRVLEENGISFEFAQVYKYFEFMEYEQLYYGIKGSFDNTNVLFVPFSVNYLQIKRHLLSNISAFRVSSYNGGFEDRYFISDVSGSVRHEKDFCESEYSGLLYDFMNGKVFQTP